MHQETYALQIHAQEDASKHPLFDESPLKGRVEYPQQLPKLSEY